MGTLSSATLQVGARYSSARKYFVGNKTGKKMGKSKKIIWRGYREFRAENNKAVKKARKNKKTRHELTLTQIKSLKEENEGLELRIQSLREQMNSLKEIYYKQQDQRNNQTTETEQTNPVAVEQPVIKTQPIYTGEDAFNEDYEMDEEKYDKLRQILNEVNILNNS